jgi:hypothetical protein
MVNKINHYLLQVNWLLLITNLLFDFFSPLNFYFYLLLLLLLLIIFILYFFIKKLIQMS